MKEAIVYFSNGAIATEQLNDRQHLVESVLAQGEHKPVKADGTEGTCSAPRQQVEAMTDGKLIAELFESIAEEHLLQPTFITDFPTEVSPLSKQRKDDPNYVERFELYIGGVEGAKALAWLHCADEEAPRFAQPVSRRRGRGAAAHQGRHAPRSAPHDVPPPTG